MNLLDSVELRRAVGQWPAGTTGTVVEHGDHDAVLVGLAGPDGSTLEILPIPTADLRVLASGPADSPARLATTGGQH